MEFKPSESFVQEMAAWLRRAGVNWAEASLAESFPVFTIDQDELARDSDLCVLARSRRRWHHQIRVGETHPMFVRSLDSENAWRIVQAFHSELPDEISRAIDTIDRGDLSFDDVALLDLPLQQIVAIWLKRSSGDLVVVAYADEADKLFQKCEVLSSQEFISRLRRHEPQVGFRLRG